MPMWSARAGVGALDRVGIGPPAAPRRGAPAGASSAARRAAGACSSSPSSSARIRRAICGCAIPVDADLGDGEVEQLLPAGVGDDEPQRAAVVGELAALEVARRQLAQQLLEPVQRLHRRRRVVDRRRRARAARRRRSPAARRPGPARSCAPRPAAPPAAARATSSRGRVAVDAEERRAARDVAADSRPPARRPRRPARGGAHGAARGRAPISTPGRALVRTTACPAAPAGSAARGACVERERVGLVDRGAGARDDLRDQPRAAAGRSAG